VTSIESIQRLRSWLIQSEFRLLNDPSTVLAKQMSNMFIRICWKCCHAFCNLSWIGLSHI